MATILFDVTAFRAMFPAFSNATTYPDAVLSMYWTMATSYVSDQTGGCYTGRWPLPRQTLALNLMTAHLAALNNLIATGQGTGGITTGATIDKVSVQLMPPPVKDGWSYWLYQTPYGTQLIALLESAAVGGFYVGGYPTVYTLRR